MGGHTDYDDFLLSKRSPRKSGVIEPKFIPDQMFDFQKSLLAWALHNERSAIFADCGLGKTLIQLAWAQNVVQSTNKPVIIFAPLAVTRQTEAEGKKFGIDCQYSSGEYTKKIIITNYQKIHHFNASDFAGIVCDESSILKSFDGSTKTAITQFSKNIPYRLLATATAAPNDYIELGTSSEALGYMGFIDMLNRFFKNDLNNSGLKRMYGEAPKWRFKGHAETPFWRWVCSWARACRMPSDIGFSNDKFILPKLIENEVLIEMSTPAEGMFLAIPAKNLDEQRKERKRTLKERCQVVADIVNSRSDISLVWCHLNDEGDMLQSMIKDSVQVSGKDNDDKKEARLFDFAQGNIKCLVSKPKIGAWGLNFQKCNHITYFPSHSYEQYYQSIRRCWRFGQKSDVTVDIVLTEGDRLVMSNMKQKAKKAIAMFENLVNEMNNHEEITFIDKNINAMEVPSWL